jgi:nitric oxide reductase NorQ protein
MKRIDLEAMDIHALRRMATAAGLSTRRKAQIVSAIADDYREGPPVSLNGSSPIAPPPPTQDGNAVVWPQVPPATSTINGDYVEPPWLSELTAAAGIGHVELSGPAGSGKTLAVHHLAASLGKRLAVVTADGGLRKRDLVGQRELINGQTALVAAEFAAASRNGDWALIDEANMAEPDALAFLNGMTDRPAIAGSTFQAGGQTVEVHPDFRCFLTRNPGYVGTRAMNEALRDRFWSIEVPPLTADALKQMLKAHDLKADQIEEGAFIVDTLYRAWEANRISYQISPRRILQAAAMCDRVGIGTFWSWASRSILTKIDAKHDRDAVKSALNATWTAFRASKA